MAAERPSLRLSRSMRVKTGRDFIDARRRGQRHVAGCLIANWLPLGPGSMPRLGVVTSRKIGSATIRSRARRLLRETFRLHQHDLRQPVTMVLVARGSIVGKHLASVERDFLSVLRQAGLLRKQ